MRRLTICGLMPNPKVWRGEPIAGSRTESRLAELLGWDVVTLRGSVRYDNLYASPTATLRLHPRAETIDAIERAHDSGSDSLLFLGTPPRCVVAGARWLTWYAASNPPEGEIMAVAFLPHPSGLNRWWNDEQNRLDAESFMRSVGEEIT